MQAKLAAIFGTVSGWTLLLVAVSGALVAIESHFTGNALADIQTIVAIIGLITKPTDMVAGHVVKRASN